MSTGKKKIQNLVLRCEQVTKKFQNFTAVDNLNFTIEEGEAVGFLGPNGAGKSTTIRMIMGLSSPTSGVVQLFGVDPVRGQSVRGNVGYCPGELRLDDELTVEQTIETWSLLRGKIDKSWLASLIERFNIDVKKKIRALSTGNRRKIGLVGAFMSKPHFLVLDEPTNGLDPLMQQTFKGLLNEAVTSGATVILSSHILSEVEHVAKRIIALREGSIVVDASIDNFLEKAGQEVEAVFKGAPRPEVFQGLKGAKDVEVVGNAVRLLWLGQPDGLISTLNECSLRSIRIQDLDLERVLLSYYQSESIS